MILVVLPAALYLGLHLLGWRYPALLWGTDQLHYYPLPLSAAFVLIALATLVIGAHPTWALRVDLTLATRLRQLAQKPLSTTWFKFLLLLLFFLTAYVFRDRTHYLGDSDMWFRTLDIYLSPERRTQINWFSTIDLFTYENLPAHEILDFTIHFQIYQLGRQILEWDPAQTYEWLSCITGAFYLWVLAKIARQLATGFLERLTFFACFATLGLAQLFFGYGESYTLVTAAIALYLCQSLRCLSGASLLYPTLCLLLAIGLHLSAFSLLPSWLYLAWKKKPVFAVPRFQVVLPLVAVGGIAGFWLYTSFYPSRLPLWTPTEEGKYSLLSIGHLGVLLNAILLCSPFGLIWGSAFLFGKKNATPELSFAGWAALGTGGLFFLHDAYLGGRDWDLMSLPALPWALWGSLCLALHPDREHYLRQMRMVVIPVMALHTALWIGINADNERAKERLAILLPFTNQPLHYRLFTQGFYYLTIQADPQQAIPYFRTAITKAPPDSLDPEGNYRNRYRKYLSEALVLTQNYEEAIEGFQETYELQDESRLSQADLDFGRARALAYFKLGEQYALQGDSAKATELWSEAVDHGRQLLSLKPDPRLYRLLARSLQKLNRLEESAQAYRQAIALEPDQAILHHLLGSILLKQGDNQGAEQAFVRAIATGDSNVVTYLLLARLYLDEGQHEPALQVYQNLLNHELPNSTSAIYAQLGIQLDSLGSADGAMTAYRKALQKDSLNVLALVNLGWHLYLTGNLEEAVDHYRRALAVQPNSVAQFNLGLAYLRLGQVELARQAYAEGAEKYGAAEAQRVGAVDDLRQLIAQGIQVAEAQRLLDTYWK